MSRRPPAIELGLPRPLTPDARRVLLFRLILANAHELRTRMDRLLADSGLTTQQAMLLQVLQAEPEPPTLTGFAARLSMSHQNLKQIATALARKGFIKIMADKSDARVRRLQLTPRHRQLWQQRDPRDHADVVQWTNALRDREVSAVVRTLDALLESLRSAS